MTQTHTRQLYPEGLRHVHLFLRTIGVGLSIALLTVAITLTTKTGETPPLTYIATIWSILVNVFDWFCLLTRSRVAPGGLLSMDLIALGLLVGGVINLAVVVYGGNGDHKYTDQGSLTTAERWLQGVLIAVHAILIGYHCLDCNMRGYREEQVVTVRGSSKSRGHRSRSSRSRHGSYRETETVRVHVRKA